MRALSAMQDGALGAPVSEASAGALLHHLSLDVGMELWVAESRGRMISSGCLEPVPGTDIAGIWGGATLASWRGRTIYRALAAARAGSALRMGMGMGMNLIHSHSDKNSRPILERCGLVKVSSATTYHWHPCASPTSTGPDPRSPVRPAAPSEP